MAIFNGKMAKAMKRNRKSIKNLWNEKEINKFSNLRLNWVKKG